MKSLTDYLTDNVEVQDLHDEPVLKTGEVIDEEDAESLLGDTYVLLGDLVERDFDAETLQTIRRLLARIEATLTWHPMM